MNFFKEDFPRPFGIVNKYPEKENYILLFTDIADVRGKDIKNSGTLDKGNSLGIPNWGKKILSRRNFNET